MSCTIMGVVQVTVAYLLSLPSREAEWEEQHYSGRAPALVGQWERLGAWQGRHGQSLFLFGFFRFIDLLVRFVLV